MADVVLGEGTKTLAGVSDGDSLFIPIGSAVIDTSTDKSAFSTGIVVLEVGKAFAGGSLGTSTAPLVAEITSRFVLAGSSGHCWWTGKDGGDATPLVQVIGGVHFHFVGDGTATRFEMAGGIADIADPCQVTNARVAGGHMNLFDAGTAVSPTLILVTAGPSGGGSVYTQRGATTATNEGGRLEIHTPDAIATLNTSGAWRESRTILRASGTITNLNAMGHIPDVSELAAPLVVTNSGVNMSLPGAQAFLDNPLITFTNPAVRYITDGRPL